MSEVYLSHNNILSALGWTSRETVDAIQEERHGLQMVENEVFPDGRTFCSLIDRKELDDRFSMLAAAAGHSRLERMLMLSIHDVLNDSGVEVNERMGLIISTTKGNIDALDTANELPASRAYLGSIAQRLQAHFGFVRDAHILSNACVSGLMAISLAGRLIGHGMYDNVIVVAGDLVTDFVLSGFNSFQAMSSAPCTPYSSDRKGVNLGEAAASVLVTGNREGLAEGSVRLSGSASVNDANHISGPSRTGEGLYRSVARAMREAGMTADSIDYISAHGTATPYNDSMESIAFERLGMSRVPLNSLKGYVGHTLGASGLLETIVGMHSLQRNTLFASKGYEEDGVPGEVSVIRRAEEKELGTFLKTSSGFGGINTAAVFEKIRG